MLSRSPPGIHVDLLHDIFPSSTQLDLMLDDLSPDAIDPSIAILDPLIPLFTRQPHSKTAKSKKETDRRGFGTYARIVNALLQVFIEDRQLAKRALWVLRHFLALSVYALDLRNVPSPIFSSSALSSSSKHDSNNYSPVFDHDVVTIGALRDVESRVKQVCVYLLGSAVGQDDGGSWRKIVLEKLLKDASTSKIESMKQGMNQVQQFLWDVIFYAKEQDKLRDTRVLKIVLESVFSDVVDVGEADLWIQLARKLEKTGMESSLFF
jgi:E3 ubiquitin-protein ligase listerin